MQTNSVVIRNRHTVRIKRLFNFNIENPESRQKIGISVLLLPPILFLVAFLIWPLMRICLMSFRCPESGVLTLSNYITVFTTPVYLKIMLYTLFVTVLITACCVLLGYPLAYFLTIMSPKVRAAMLSIVLIPFYISILVRMFAWMAILNRQGLINKVLLEVGIISEPLKMVFNLFGVSVNIIHYLLPFMIIPILNAMLKIDHNLLWSSSSLGARPMQTFMRVFLPLSMPGVIAGSMMCFILTLGYYIVPAYVGGPQNMVISLVIEQEFRRYLNWEIAGALSMILVVSTSVILYVANKWLGVSQIFGQVERS